MTRSLNSNLFPATSFASQLKYLGAGLFLSGVVPAGGANPYAVWTGVGMIIAGTAAIVVSCLIKK